MKPFACPCCGQFTLTEEAPGTYQVCSVCHWEDDYAQFMDHDLAGGANDMSLNQAQAAYQEKQGGGITLDTDGTQLTSGDTVQLTETLDVKGSKLKLLKGTVVKNIRVLQDDPENIEVKIEGSVIVLKTKFLRKRSK